MGSYQPVNVARVTSRTSHHAVVDASILFVAAIWGSSYLAMQVAGRTTSASELLMLRFACAVPFMAIVARRSLRALSIREAKAGAIFGCLLFGILYLETVGVQHTTVANAGFLITLSVVLVPAFERVLNGRRQARLVYIAAAAGCVGCALLSLSSGFTPRLGDLIIVAAALIRALHITLLGRRSNRDLSSLNVTFVQLVVVLMTSLVVVLASGNSPVDAVATAEFQAWLLIAYLGAFGTAFAFFAQLRAARISSSTRVGFILCTEPVFAAVFAVGLNGEHLAPAQLWGGAIVVASVIAGRFAESRNSPKDQLRQDDREREPVTPV